MLSVRALLFKLTSRLFGTLKRDWNRWRFVLVEAPGHTSCELGHNVVFNVPVRSGGSGVVRIGNHSCFGLMSGFRLGSGEISLFTGDPQAEIVIGNGTFLNSNVSIGSVQSIVIGNDCLIGACVAITDCDFHDVNPKTRHAGRGPIKPVKIGNNVWLGTGVTVLKGVAIGDNSVLGAMSVVTTSIPENCVAAGNPARIVRKLD